MRAGLVLFLLLTGCVKMREANDQQVCTLVSARTDSEVAWAKEDRKPLQPTGCLTSDDAVRVALFNNLRAQAEFERLGIAQAELEQAGLFKNPVFAGFVRFPTAHSSVVNTEVSFTQSFLELFLIPLRKKIAQNELERVELEVANFFLTLIYDVRLTYYTLQASIAKRALVADLLQLKDLEFQLSGRQHQAGTISPLEYMQKREDFLKTTLTLYELEEKILESKKALALLLGIEVEDSRWHVDGALSSPKSDVSKQNLAKRANELRLELLIARHDIKRYIDMGAEKKWWAYTESSTGVSYEKDSDKICVLGPTFSFALPFFDHGQAERARLAAYIKQSRHQLKALKQEIMHEVAQGKCKLELAKARYELVKNTMLTLVQERLSVAKEYYGVMALGLYSLLKVKEEEVLLKIDSVDALYDYWVSYTHLEKSVGGHIE